jgi:hypothetical protein
MSTSRLAFVLACGIVRIVETDYWVFASLQHGMLGQQVLANGGRPVAVSAQGQVYSTPTTTASWSALDWSARQLQGLCLSSSNAADSKSDIGAHLNAQTTSNLHCRAEPGAVEGVNVLIVCAFCR